jgi:uncharacterized protein (DUF427 family)
VHCIANKDVDQMLLRSRTTSTDCPYEGDASYYSIAGPDREIEDAIWTYEHPYAAVETIAGQVAFYADQVEITETGEDSCAGIQNVYSRDRQVCTPRTHRDE